LALAAADEELHIVAVCGGNDFGCDPERGELFARRGERAADLPAPSGAALRAKAPLFGYLAPLGSSNAALRSVAWGT